jgi:hypothetical protein
VSFLNGIFLFGLLGVLLPLLIHLFQRRRARKLDFPSLRFMHEENLRQMRRLNFRRLLLLLLRMLIIALLALALARPTLRGPLARVFPEKTPRSLALILDRSASMQSLHEDGSLFDLALRRAREILSPLDENDEVLLLGFGENVDDPLGGFASPSLVREFLENWKPGEGKSFLRPALSQAIRSLSLRPHPLREIFLLSDFALSEADTVPLPDPGDLRIMALPLADELPPNAGFVNLQLPRRPVLAGKPFELSLSLESKREDSFPVDLLLDEQYSGSLEFSPGPGRVQTRSLSLGLKEPGKLRGVWRKKKDRYAPDDELPFVLPVHSFLRVLLLGRAESGLARHLGLALDPASSSSTSPLELLQISTSSLESVDLEARHAVLLAGGAGLGSSSAKALAAYVKSGGGLLLFPDRESLPVLARELLPELDGPRSLELAGSERLQIRELHGEHSLFEDFDEVHREILRDQSFSEIFRCSVGGRQVLARFEGGLPAVLAWNYGRGRVRLLLFDAGPAGGEFPWSSLFLPLIQEMVQEVSGAQLPRTATVGESLEWEIKSFPTEGQRLFALSEDGSEQRLRLDASRFPPRAILDRVGKSGFWSLHLDSPEGRRDLGLRAVRVPPEEGFLQAPDADSLATLLDVESLLSIPPGEKIGDFLRFHRFGREITRLLLWLVLALLLLELWVSRRLKTD